ncbi:MAG: phosphatase PAP2 family protein [Bacteroidales bacterium]|nr:phosphatase PAP2 family protein [Bacteroidales bacterium]
MKIDTSSYYPEPLLPPEDKDSGSFVEDESFVKHDNTTVQNHISAHNVADDTLDNILDEIDERGGFDSKDSFSGGPLDMLSTLLSWIFVPLLMPVYGMILLFDLSILSYAPSASKWMFTLVVFFINCVIPMILILLLKKMGVVQDYGLNGRRERLVPYIITALCMGTTAWYMSVKGAPLWIAMFFAGGGLAAVINTVINFRWKISAHAAGIAGVVAMMVRVAHIGFRPDGAAFAWLIIWIMLAGLLGAARVWLGRHTVWQVMGGYAVGFLSVYLLITYI